MKVGRSMSVDLDQIMVGGRRVGIINLRKVLVEVQTLGLVEADDVMVRLLEGIKKYNYVPPGAEESYRRALYAEYRRFSGERLEDEYEALEIAVLGPGCPRCDELTKRVMSVVAEMRLIADIRHIKDLETIGEYGPVSTPALVVNGRVRIMGKVPSVDELRNVLSGRVK